MAAPSRSALFLSGLLAAAGTAHFVAPRGFDAIVPEALPGDPRRWTRLSGVAEVALAAGVAHPRTRRLAAGLTGAFFVAVFPANLQMAADWRNRSPVRRAVAYGRLPSRCRWCCGRSRSGAGQAAPPDACSPLTPFAPGGSFRRNVRAADVSPPPVRRPLLMREGPLCHTGPDQ